MENVGNSHLSGKLRRFLIFKHARCVVYYAVMVTLLLDCDGVLADVQQACLDLVYRETGLVYNKSDIKHWDIFDEPTLQMFDKRVFFSEVSSGKFVRGIRPFNDAKEMMPELKNLANVHIVTAPLLDESGVIMGRWVEERCWWLNVHFGFNSKQVTFSSEKHLLNGDVFVDDKPANVAAWKKKYPQKIAILWKTSFNQHSAGECNADYLTDDWQFVKNLLAYLGEK